MVGLISNRKHNVKSVRHGRRGESMRKKRKKNEKKRKPGITRERGENV